MGELELQFPKPKRQPITVKSGLLQSVRLEVKPVDGGYEITLQPRHIKGEGAMLGPGQTAVIEDDDAAK